jgi:hypothetical protein
VRKLRRVSQPSRRRIVWWWSAAACSLVAYLSLLVVVRLT